MSFNDSGAGPAERPAPGPARGEQVSVAGPAPERVAEVRRRILEGAYESAEVVGRVAEAILRSRHV